MTFAQLKKKAAALGYTLTEERGYHLEVHSPEGKGWEDGALTSLVAPYGSEGSYLPEWRQTAIDSLSKDLDEPCYSPAALVDLDEEDEE